MSRADPDGKIAQLVADMHTCLGMEISDLGMEISESIREAAAKLLAEIDRDGTGG